MKLNIVIPVFAALAALTGCVTDPATSRQKLSPEMQAAVNRVGVTAITAAEAALVHKINQQLKPDTSGK
jgi:hypothetical protein